MMESQNAPDTPSGAFSFQKKRPSFTRGGDRLLFLFILLLESIMLQLEGGEIN